ncbi:MAG: carbon-nitrogen hydrolase family protein, partial [Pseudomonadota bacterium]
CSLEAMDTWANGGSCIAAPDGSWLVEPVADQETTVTATLEIDAIRAARHNFDPSGHYARPDVTQLTVNRTRQRVGFFIDE